MAVANHLPGTLVPSPDGGFQHLPQVKRVQAQRVLGRQRGQQPGQQGVNFIVHHDDMQRPHELQGGYARINGSVNHGRGACVGSTGDEGGSVLPERDD